MSKPTYSENQILLEARRILRKHPDQAPLLLEHIGRDEAYRAFKVMADDLGNVHKIVTSVIGALKPLISQVKHASHQAQSDEAPARVPGTRPDH